MIQNQACRRMNSLTVHIGGVPEHFNYPWYLLLKSKELHKEQINLIWRDFDGGTGAMVHSLVNGEIDLAVMLTEGVTKAICDGADQTYSVFCFYATYLGRTHASRQWFNQQARLNKSN